MKKSYISILSFISALAVVMLHSNTAYWTYSEGRYWIVANAIECVFYFAVPVFFMISGATLIDYTERYDTKTYLKKRFMKTVVPFLIWSFIGFWYQVRLDNINLKDVNLKWIVESLSGSNIVEIYWFFIPLFAMYFFIVLLAHTEKSKREPVFRLILIAMFIFNFLLPFVFARLKWAYNGNLKLPMYGFAFFVISGYYIANYEINRLVRLIIYAMGIAGLMLHFFGTWKLSSKIQAIDYTYKGYESLPCVCYSIAIFVFFRYLDGTKLMRFIEKLANPFVGTTFGIYLIHWYLIQLISSHASFLEYTKVFNRMGLAVFVFVISAIITKLTQKILGDKNLILPR